MKGERIHLLEKLDLAGGSCDGRKDVTDELSQAANNANQLASQLKDIALRINEQVNNFHV